jgi:hypothetical protein
MSDIEKQMQDAIHHAIHEGIDQAVRNIVKLLAKMLSLDPGHPDYQESKKEIADLFTIVDRLKGLLSPGA